MTILIKINTNILKWFSSHIILTRKVYVVTKKRAREAAILSCLQNLQGEASGHGSNYRRQCGTSLQGNFSSPQIPVWKHFGGNSPEYSFLDVGAYPPGMLVPPRLAERQAARSALQKARLAPPRPAPRKLRKPAGRNGTKLSVDCSKTTI